VVAQAWSGDGRTTFVKTYELRPYEFRQVDRFLSQVAPDAFEEAFVTLHTTTLGGAFLAYASVTDNRSGDPIYVPARVVE
jgi:hypothetical protein